VDLGSIGIELVACFLWGVDRGNLLVEETCWQRKRGWRRRRSRGREKQGNRVFWERRDMFPRRELVSEPS